MNSISPNLNLMIKACEKASKIVIRDFGELENLQVSKKGPKDFVTKTDKRVEKILIEELSKSKKNYSFISEETGKILNTNRDIFWVIDPIDGTTNFLHGIPHFAISLALQQEGKIVIGLIFDPIKNEIFYAEKDSGSFINNNRAKVSNKSNLEECLFASNSEGWDADCVSWLLLSSLLLVLSLTLSSSFFANNLFNKKLICIHEYATCPPSSSVPAINGSANKAINGGIRHIGGCFCIFIYQLSQLLLYNFPKVIFG